MWKPALPLIGLGALGIAAGIPILANVDVPLGMAVTAAGILPLSAAGGLALRARWKSASVAESLPEKTPLRARTDLSSEDKAEVWMAIQTMQRHHGHSDLLGLIDSKKIGRSLDADDCWICGQPRFQRSLSWLQEVLAR